MSFANGVIMQFFQWYLPPDGSLWNELNSKASELASNRFTAVWIPPAYKGFAGVDDAGYGVYDLFDLGEFNQKGETRTKYGTKAELQAAIAALHHHGIEVYGDVVLNHKLGADETEKVQVQQVDFHDRNRLIGESREAEVWTKFTHPGRAGKYSDKQWDWQWFDCLGYIVGQPKSDDDKVVYRLKDKHFETEVSYQYQNYDYLLGCDTDTSNHEVWEELVNWGKWFAEQTGVDGFRIDAVKHIRYSFYRDWLPVLRQYFGRELFSVGEYWSWGNVEDLHHYITNTNGVMSLFDVPLHVKLHYASKGSSGFDMRTIFDRTLVKEQPALAVTFVENHDSQPCQALESTVEPWFKPHAYALILLRRDGYPCVFYADYYGAFYHDKNRDVTLYSHRWLIDKFLWARQAYGFGDQHDYFDHPNTIGWVRLGTAEHPGAMAVVMTNGADGHKWMNVFRPNVTFYDITEHISEKVHTNEHGWGNFRCKGGSVSVWLQE
jgi:alpha-amylase